MRTKRLWSLGLAVLLVSLFVETAGAQAGNAAPNSGVHRVSGAGKTIIEGGTGGTPLLPVTTTVAFHATAQGGDFECLALVPKDASSGAFTTNAMYVTGKVTSLAVQGDTATLRGTATVTGLGAGTGQAFTARVTDGGPGATVKLEVSGLTFNEILVEGHISVR